jgi:regulator of sigma E protease
MLGIVAAVIVLGLLIVVHEFGHFVVAKKSGVGVLKFSVGFGPKLFGKIVGGTEYVLSAIPLGGYVKMVGEDPDSDAEDVADPRISFSHQPLWKRAAIVFAGPGFNLLFAFVAFSFVFWVYGARVPSEVAKVGGVMDGMPAARAGLQTGDIVNRVDSTPIKTWEQLSAAIRASGGKEVELAIDRDGQTQSVQVRPESKPDKNIFGETIGTAYVIGIERGSDLEEVGSIRAVAMGASQTGWWIETLLISVAKILQGKIPAKDIGGPILIVQAAGQQAQVGLESLLHFMAVISINLGILNLLPIPILDGGHLLFLSLEAVMRRPLDTRHRELAQQVGFVILICLMAFAFYNDFARVLQNWG